MWLWVLLFALACLPTVAAGQDQAPPVPEQTAVSSPLAVVTKNANLRTTPTRRGTILAVAQKGAVVQVLEESGSWSQVRTEAGTVAWIHRGVLVLPNKPLARQPDLSPIPPPEPLTEERHTPATGQQEYSPEPEIERPAEGQRALVPEPPASLTSRPDDSPRTDFQGPTAYLLAALLISTLVILGLQLRRARQPKQTMHGPEQGVQPPAPVRELSGDASPQPPPVVPDTPLPHLDADAGPQGAAEVPPLVSPDTHTIPLPDLPVELSPLEQAVLTAIAEREEVQERELGKMLEKRGFHGVLIKAVVGDIIRKIGDDGPPWVRVRRTSGHYSYRFAVPRPTGAPKQG